MNSRNDRNIFTGNRIYKLDRSLLFISSSTEYRYRYEIYMQCKKQLALTIAFIAVLGIRLIFDEVLSPCEYLYLLLACAFAIIPKGKSQKHAGLTWLPVIILNMWAWGTTSVFVACLPGFLIQRYTIPHWKVLAKFSLPAAIFLFYCYSSVYEIIVTNISFVFLSGLFEKNSRYNWVVQDSFKKSTTLYRTLHQNDPNGAMIIDPLGEVINRNQAADDLMTKFGNITKNDQIQALVERSRSGEEIDNEELVILDATEQQFAFLIKVQPFVWKRDNCVKINLTEVTGHRIRELKITQMISKLKRQSTDLVADFVKLLTSQEPQDSEQFYKFSKFYYKTRMMYELQAHSQGGTRNIPSTSFNFRDELRKTMEHCYVEACEKQIDFCVGLEAAIPKYISGDVWGFKLAIYCVMSIASQLTTPLTQIILSTSVAVKNNLYEISFRWAFNSRADISALIELLGSSRINLNSVASANELNNKLFRWAYVLNIVILDHNGQITDLVIDEPNNSISFSLCMKWDETGHMSQSYYHLTGRCQQLNDSRLIWRHDLPESQQFEGSPVTQQSQSLGNAQNPSESPQPPRELPVQSLFSDAVQHFNQLQRSEPEPPAEQNPEQIRRIRYHPNGRPRLGTIQEDLSAETDLIVPDEECKLELPAPIVIPSFTSPSEIQESSNPSSQPLRRSADASPGSASGRWNVAWIKNTVLLSSPSSATNPAPREAFNRNQYLTGERRQVLTPEYLRMTKRQFYSEARLSDQVKVLIVDDSHFSVTAFRNIIDQLGQLQIDEVNGGTKWIEYYKELYAKGFIYNVIFIDLIMPIMDGFQTTQQLRRLEESENNLPSFICGISGDAHEAVEQRCLQSGMDFFIQKPTSVETLNLVLKKAIEKQENLML